MKEEFTFKDFRESRVAMTKLFELPGFPDWEESIMVAKLKQDFVKVDELFTKGSNSIALKYGKMAEKRITQFNPGGYNSADEQESNLTETELFLNSPVPVKLDFPVLKKETFKALMKEMKDEKAVLSLSDLSVFDKLGMIGE